MPRACWLNVWYISTVFIPVAAACEEEAQQLRKENEHLKKNVIDLKNRLIAAEVKNGGWFRDRSNDLTPNHPLIIMS